MKKLTGILLVFLTLGFSMNAQMAAGDHKNNYIVLTTKIPQMEPIILTANSLKEEDGEKFGDFQIVLYGLNIKGLTNIKEMDKYVNKAKATGVQIMVCKLSLAKLKINSTDLHPYIKVVDHAFTHAIELQKNKNYYSLEL
ncbi:sulfur reduction protein DsrE [Salegentibacter sp. LM13S]|uniref:sulfur reduction protein DsrE n=1 Tax=Salegentibacter lacus TaxID=2873599 RepID=UPI001CCC84A2|nr:sulfur reduction protein DsrE [Salegentibacter lacus]MBZ9630364.1 sulfur reduction protein DsrE [Salegentibacter lacus]